MSRIPLVSPESIDDPEIAGYIETALRRGTPRAESQLVRAHVPAVIRSFSQTFDSVFHSGVVDHALKELCRVYLTQSLKCNYCSTQRSGTIGSDGVGRDYEDLLRFRQSDLYSAREKVALEYADAIIWDPSRADDDLWARLYEHFSTEELVELGYFIAIGSGQARWISTLGLQQINQYNPTETLAARETALTSGSR